MSYLNSTGLSRLWTKIKAYIDSKVIGVAQGGTGATTVAAAQTNLGVAISAETVQMFKDAGYPVE